MSYCSPNINVTNHYTCFEHDELKEIALALNIYIQKNKLCLLDKSTSKTCSTKIINIGKKTKKQLWYSIYNRLKIICPYEYCWVDLDFINNIKDRYLRDKIRDFTFKPKGPKTANSWLWTEDINRVLQQYGSIDKTFKFLGALPSDFYKITKMNWTNICNYNKFSIVFNLDNHKQSGSHWVAFLIDNKTKTIEYYDSIGNLPNTNINVFIKHVQNFLHKKCKTKYEILYNTTKQQYENNECGMFAIHFIITRLLGKSFHDISNMKITDKDMNRFRKIVFRPKVERKTQKLNYIKINF
jgi:hypothetical protein